MSSIFPYDRRFQIGILALCTQKLDFLLMASEIVKPSYFEDKILIWYYETILKHYGRYQVPPTEVVLQNELKKAARAKKIKAEEIKAYVEVLKAMQVRVASSKYITDEVIRFCRRQEGRKIYLETAEMMDTADDEDWDHILERLFNVKNIGITSMDLGIDFFKEAESRARARLEEDTRIVAPTGIRGWKPGRTDLVDLDSLMSGGLKAGQLGIWMGPTGAGKSIALVHCGKRAVVGGMKVLHYTLELSAQDIADRYDAAWTHSNISHLDHYGTGISDRITQLADKHGFHGRLMIKGYPTGMASVNTIRGHLRMLETVGWVPDVIIVDYLDLLKPLTNYNDEYADLGAIAKDLRGLGIEQEVPLWSATQTNRAGFNQEIVDIEHMGDSIKKAQIADLIIALCRTREEKINNIMRLFFAKNRNGPDKVEVEIRTDYAKMCFFDINGQPVELPSNAPPETE